MKRRQRSEWSREVRDQLGRLTLAGPPILDQLLPTLHHELESERSVAYALHPTQTGLELAFVLTEGVSAAVMRRETNAFLAHRTVGWGGYNPLRPEPEQRNRVVVRDDLVAARAERPIPIVHELYPRIGLANRDSMRLLVCEGPSLLAWIGFHRSDPFVETDALASLAPALEARLRLERQLATLPRVLATLATALELLGAPAFVIRRTGRVLEANSAGRLLLETKRTETMATLIASLTCPREVRAYDLTPIQSAGEPPTFLAVRRQGTPDEELKQRVAAAAKRWELTPRQADVLAQLADGRSNRAIAAALGIAEVTAENHLTAIFMKSETESRAELVSRVLRTCC